MYSTVVIGLPKDDLESKLRALKIRRKVKDDTELDAEDWKQLVQEYKSYFKDTVGASVS